MKQHINQILAYFQQILIGLSAGLAALIYIYATMEISNASLAFIAVLLLLGCMNQVFRDFGSGTPKFSVGFEASIIAICGVIFIIFPDDQKLRVALIFGLSFVVAVVVTLVLCWIWGNFKPSKSSPLPSNTTETPTP